MSVIRAFIAIEISPEIRQKLEELSNQLRSELRGVPVRWVPVENIHLTLKFLGNVSLANLEVLTKLLRAEAAAHPAFEISIGELGAFPSNRRPWVIKINVQAPSELEAVQRGIETETARLGYDREERPFSPHLTIGRISRNASSGDVRRVSAALDRYKVGFLGAMRVDAIHLFQSDLNPAGAVYSKLNSAQLHSGNGSV